MTTCERLDAFLDRRLEASEAERFRAHVASCAACAAAVQQWHQIERDVVRWAEAQSSYEPSPFVGQRLARRANESREGAGAPRRRRRWAVGLAAAATVALAVIGVRLSGEAPESGVATLQLRVIGGALQSPAGGRAGAGVVLAPAGGSRMLVELGEDRVGISRAGKVEILEARDRVTRLKLHEGIAGFQIARRLDGETFQVVAGQTAVTVVGTRFMVGLRPSGVVDVSVAEGKVRVESPDGESHLVEADEAAEIGGSGRALITSMSTHAGRSLERLLREPPETGAQASARGLRATPERGAVKRSKGAKTRHRAEPRAAKVDLDTWRGWVLAGRYGAAEEALAAHVATDKHDVEALSLLADCYRKQGKWKAAVKAYSDIIEADAGAAAERARFQAASILQDEIGDHAAAVPLLRAYIARHPPVRSLEAAARVRLARSLDVLGKQNAADQQLRAVVEEFPGTTAASEAEELLELEPDSGRPNQ